MVDRILLSVNADVAEVRLNRPEKVNAIGPAMFEALVAVGKRLTNEADLHAVVLSGEGCAFCVDLDMGSMASLGSNDAGSNIGTGRLVKRTHGAANLPQYACTVQCDLPVSVLVAVHDVAYSGGLQTVLGVDVYYVVADTCLSVMEIKRGPVPDMDGMALTRGLVHPDRLRELIYSGRVANGEEVFVLGLATHVVDDPYAAALAAAYDIVLRSPDTTRVGKRLMRIAEDGDTAAILLAELTEQDRLIGTDNRREAVLAGTQNHVLVFQPAAKSGQKLEIAWGWQLRRWRV